MGSSVMVLVGQLLWAMRRPTTAVVVLMATVGAVVVLLVGGSAVANVPPPDTSSGTTPSGDTGRPKNDFVALAYSESLQYTNGSPFDKVFLRGAPTLGRAKYLAMNDCVKTGGKYSDRYTDDCQGIAWVL